MPASQNIFTDPVETRDSEHFLTLFESPHARIERIVSHSHASPEGFWYDQDHDEWVIVLKGSAALEFEGGSVVEMKPGDYRLIQKHERHRVDRTAAETVWLAVHV